MSVSPVMFETVMNCSLRWLLFYSLLALDAFLTDCWWCRRVESAEFLLLHMCDSAVVQRLIARNPELEAERKDLQVRMCEGMV